MHPGHHYSIALFNNPSVRLYTGVEPMTTTTATQSKQLTKKELKKFQELLEEKRKAVLDRARENVKIAGLDPALRSRGIDLVHLFRCVCGSTPLVCDVCHGAHACAFRGLTDAHIVGRKLARWERSGLFRVRSNVHDPYYGLHRVYFFLLATGDEIARVEVPEWVARDQALLGTLHAVLTDQIQKGFGYPAVLARADDRAVISLSDRTVLDTLVQQELARHGVVARPSAKLSRKQVRTV